MKGTLSLKTGPTIYGITVAEMKSHARVDIADDDAYLTTLIAAGTNYIEALTGIRFVSQVWYYYLDKFPGCDCIELPIGPVSAVAVKYLVEDAEAQSTFAASSYTTDLASLPARIVLKDGKSWPSDTLEVVNGVIIEITAGYSITGTASNAPADLKAALKLLVSHWYEHRMAAGEAELKETPLSVNSLLANYRMWSR